MEKIFSATEARIHFGALMQDAQNGPVIVERDGKPQVVILSKPAYDALMSGVFPRAWRQLVIEARQQAQADLGKRSLPSPEEMIRQVREERDAQLNHLR
jgi:prevent-host-death family protein